jgi:hypothetical protein
VCDRPRPFGETAEFFDIGHETSVGAQYLYHNTMLQAGVHTVVSGRRFMRNTVTRNNLFIARAYSLRGLRYPGNDFDYDLLNATVEVLPGQEEHAVRGTRPQWREGHGPVAGRTGRYQLRPGSPGFDAGTLLPNFNDGYTGAAPDIGAHEYGTPDRAFGIEAWQQHKQAFQMDGTRATQTN